jgi:subtilase family serine protease
MSAFDRRFWLLSSSTFLLACSLLDTPLCNAQGLQHPYSLPRIAGAIDESSLVSLRGNTHPLAQLKYDQGTAPISMPANRLLLVLARSTQQEADLQTWLQSVQDANSPNYRKFLSPEDFGKRFGVGDADLQAIQTWLAGHGFTVNKVSKGRMAIEFSGSVGQVQDAFHTSLHSYIVNGEQHWANATDPQIPSALAPVVAGFSSLNNFKPRTQYIRGPSGVFNAQTRTITPAYTDTDGYGDYYIYLGPADAATIYNTPTSLNANLVGTAYDGTGVTIGVAGDSNIDVAQNANYRSTFGLTPNPTTVVVDGNDPGENGDSIEAYLDTQVSGGIAPNANIILYTAADNSLQQGLFLAIQRAIDDNQADILNVSFGECEAALGASGNQYIQNLWEQAAAQGISVVVSAGDSGPAGCDNPDTESLAYLGLAVNGLASTPDNIAVGGTDFDILYSNFPSSFTTYVNTTNTLPNRRSAFGYIPEEPWNDSTYPNSDISENVSLNHNSASLSGDDIIAGGGGISSLYTIPSWQASFASGGYRNLPDVSLLAGNGFYGALWSICTDQAPAGYADCAAGATRNSFYLTGIGGTSASAPAFAGMLALVKQKTGIRLGHAGYVLYDLAKTSYSTVFHDITTGDNSVNCEIINGGCSEDTAGYYFMNGYNATVGYDMASGLGSVNASQMVSNWASPGFNATTSSLQLNGATAPLSITHGQSVAVNSSVTSASGTPSGNIALVDNLTPANLPNSEGIGDFTLSSGSVSGTTNSLPGGTYQVSAHYGGSGTFAQSDSNAISVTVGPESSNTTIKVVGYYDPASGKAATTPYYGFKFVIDAQPYGNSASAANPNGVATGIVTFKNGSTTLSTATLASNGIAEMQTTLLPGGTDTLTAAFSGDASFLASTSSPYPFTVVPAVTTLAIPSYQASYNNVISVGVLLSVDSAGAAPTGTVTIQNGSTALGSAPLYGIVAVGTTPTWGSATFDSSSLPPGTYNITAVYSGDGNYGSSTSPVVSLTLGRANSSITVSTSATIISANQPLQVTVTPAPLAGLPLPTGSATLTYGSVTTPPADLVNGTASFTIPPNSLPLGFGPIAGNYSGDADYASGSANAWVTVNSSGTVKPIVTVTGPSVTVNYPVSITVTVSGLSGDPTPTGSVTLTTVAGQNSMPLTNGSAIFTLQNGLLAGPSPVIAVYLGDLNYTSGSGSTTVDTFAPVAISFAPYPLPTIEANQPLSLTVAIVGYPNFQTATGTVTLSSGSYTSGPIQMASGSASFNIPANALSVGIDTLTASYSGDSNYLAGSNTEPVTVTAIPSPSFSLTGTAVTVAPGSSSTSTVTITPSGGFTGSVVMSAVLTSTPSGADYLPNLSFSSTNPVAITGASAGTATLTVYTTAATSAALAHPKHPGTPWYAVGGATLACLLLLGIPARRRSWRRALGMLTLLVVLSSGVFACGGGGGSGGGGGGGGGTGNPGTTAGAYTITVTGTSGTITVNGTIALTVQ